MRTFRAMVRILIPALAILPAARGQFVEQGSKLVGSQSIGTSHQGKSVAISADGNTAIVGGPTDNNEIGAAWIYVRVDGTWSQQGPKLVGSNQGGRVGQGYSVALSADGNTALVGGPLDNGYTGAVWVFTRTNGAWSQQGPKLTSATGAIPQQGAAVALSADGNTAVVGVPNESAILVYTRTNGQWTPQGPLLTALPKDSTSYFGASVAVSADGDTIFAGDTGEAGGVGGSWAFVRSGGVWSQQGGLISGSNVIGAAQQGIAVALSADGNTAIVGGSTDNLQGALWVFTRSNGEWNQQGPKLVAPELGSLALGQSVALSADGNVAIAGAPGFYGGAVTFVRRNGVWSRQGPIFGNGVLGPGSGAPPSGAATEQGASVSLSAAGDTAILGAPADNLEVGSALVFQQVSSELTTSTPLTASGGVPFTFSVLSLGAAFNGVLHFSSSDPQAILPPDSPLPANLAAVLNTPGNQTITATQTLNALSSVTSAPIQVSAANLPVDIALGKPANQIPDLPGYPQDAAASAVDGNTDGDFFHGSVTATGSLPNAWWQVDLGISSPITSIVIWNRTDCCASRLTDYWVFVSDTPFFVNETPATLQSRPGTWAHHETAAPNPSTVINTGIIQGRYLRVQLSGVNYLSLAEVQVFGNPVPNWNQARSKPAAQSSTYPGYPAPVAANAVDGNPDGNFFHGSVTATNLDPRPWWQVDLGVTHLIDSIILHNRTDCCGSRLGEYYLLSSALPFVPTDDLPVLLARATNSSHQTNAPNPAAAIGFGGARGRYLRLQLPSPGYLSLAEVEVSGRPNLAARQPASQSSVLPFFLAGATASAAVDGDTDGDLNHGSVAVTNLEPNPGGRWI